jgi:hypothetical protein
MLFAQDIAKEVNNYLKIDDDKLVKSFKTNRDKDVESSKVCHTHHRGCNKSTSYEGPYPYRPENAHFYANKVDCIKLNSSSFASISAVFMIVLALLF